MPDPMPYDSLLRANLQRVFNERDAGKRNAALEELFVAEPIMYEPEAEVFGKSAISEVAGKLLDKFGPTFRFVAEGQAAGHHGIASLRWTAGLEGGPPLVTGIDTASVVDGKIAKLWVLLDAAPRPGSDDLATSPDDGT